MIGGSLRLLPPLKLVGFYISPRILSGRCYGYKHRLSQEKGDITVTKLYNILEMRGREDDFILNTP
jgi:hypothetical protein